MLRGPSTEGRDPSVPAGAVSLRLLLPFVALFGVVLYFIAGTPRTPGTSLSVPDVLTLEALLRSPRPPLEGAIYAVGMLGWVAWGWLVLSLVLQVLVALAERLSAGATWVGGFRTLAD